MNLKDQDCWIDINDEIKLPDITEPVLTLCPKMGRNGETEIIVAYLVGDNEWYSGFPKDQPVEPSHWCHSIKLIK